MGKKKDHKGGPYAVRLFLPFNLLLLRTSLPVAVFILFLKPCSMALWRFLG